jgi:hypothetical protein
VIGEVGELLAKAGFRRGLRTDAAQPVAKGLDQRPGPFLTRSAACGVALPLDVGLDLVEFGDAAQALLGDGRCVAVKDLAQLAPAVRPAMRQTQRIVPAAIGGDDLVGDVATPGAWLSSTICAFSASGRRARRRMTPSRPATTNRGF